MKYIVICMLLACTGILCWNLPAMKPVRVGLVLLVVFLLAAFAAGLLSDLNVKPL